MRFLRQGLRHAKARGLAGEAAWAFAWHYLKGWRAEGVWAIKSGLRQVLLRLGRPPGEEEPSPELARRAQVLAMVDKLLLLNRILPEGLDEELRKRTEAYLEADPKLTADLARVLAISDRLGLAPFEERARKVLGNDPGWGLISFPRFYRRRFPKPTRIDRLLS